ncbi:MAG: TolC family protein [Cyanobacteriota bacterium]|nr:TolC family protein [Cyanobacteriota bacterium]
MRLSRFTTVALLGLIGLPASPTPASAQTVPPPAQAVPLAPKVKGSRPKADPSVMPPAATKLAPELEGLAAPDPLSLPVQPVQVRIQELRPLSLLEVEQLAEFNNPDLKAIASQVEQAQSNLRAQIALWYPNINLNINSFPSFTAGSQFSSAITGTGQQRGTTYTSIWQTQAALQVTWPLIDPTRTPQIAAARDSFERAKNQYLIALRELRLQANESYFDLQRADDQVRTFQESVRASLVSVRDARARFQAGVATRLDVLRAETQLAFNQQELTSALATQAIARRTLAGLLSLPPNVTPTAKEPAAIVGTWKPSLQESIVAAYAFREELDQTLLDISIANSNANAQLGQVQPFLNIFNTLRTGRSRGSEFVQEVIPDETSWSFDNTVGLNLTWNLFDGGRARALYRESKQRANENRFRFAQRRNSIREEVEESYFTLESTNRNIATTTREVVAAREALRLSRLRFQAGVVTQSEVVDTQRDLTRAEVSYAIAVTEYNKALARLRRRTGLDQIELCQRPALPATKPVIPGVSDVPVEPRPLVPACRLQGPTGSLPNLLD